MFAIQFQRKVILFFLPSQITKKQVFITKFYLLPTGKSQKIIIKWKNSKQKDDDRLVRKKEQK